MGIEYNLYNHANCTYYELGKGSWWSALLGRGAAHALYDVEVLEIQLTDLWKPSFDGWTEYLKALSADLCRFVGDIPENRLEIIGDLGDEHWQARALGYVCTGSRYNLSDPIKNKENIDEQNGYFQDQLDPTDVERLRSGKWNFSNFEEQRRPRSRYEILMESANG